MANEAASWGLSWDATAADSVAAGQRWVLASMQKYGPDLLKLLWRILGNDQDVCDAYQDTFVRLANRGDGCVPDDARAFVFRSAANTAISMLRRRRQQLQAARRMAMEPRPTAPPADGREMDEARLRDSLQSCLARLPEKLQEVVVLKDLAELPYRQVARMLGMSQTAARVYRCRAIQLLGSWMARQEEDL